MFDQALDHLFLRLYAKNLARSFRGEPENACADAEIQLSTILLLTIGALILIIGSLLFPQVLTMLFRDQHWSIGFLVAITLAVVIGVHRRFGRYAKAPHLAEPYRTQKNSRWSFLLFWSVLVIWVIVTLMTVGHFRS